MTASSVGYDGRLLQTYLILIGYLQRVPDNATVCSKVLAEHKAKLKAAPRRRNQTDKLIYPAVKALLDEHIESIKDKDFSFLTSNDLVILDTNVSNLVSKFWSSTTDDDLEDKVVAELLALFFEIMSPEDQKEVMKAHAVVEHPPQTITSEKKPEAQIPNLGNMNLNGLVDKIMRRHKDKINRAEGDPRMMNEAIQSIIQDSSGDLVNIISGAVTKQ